MSNPKYLPKKCAIVLPNKNSVSLDQYFLAVGEKIGYENIIYGGKHGQRVLMHLTSEELVDSFTTELNHVTIDSVVFPVKKLVNPGFKLVFNHVNPSIPNSALLQEVCKFTRPLSDVTYVPTGLRDPRMSHILSYRRQVFIDSKDNVPNFITVSQDSELNSIYLTVDNTIRCYSCGVEGHNSKNCPSKSAHTQVPPCTNFLPGSFPELKNPHPISSSLKSVPEIKTSSPTPQKIQNVPDSTKLTILHSSDSSCEDKYANLSNSFPQHFVEWLDLTIPTVEDQVSRDDILKVFHDTKGVTNHVDVLSVFEKMDDEVLFGLMNVLETFSPKKLIVPIDLKKQIMYLLDTAKAIS